MKNKSNTEINLRELLQSGRGQKIKIKKSVFIATAYKIKVVEDKIEILEKIKKEMKKATHNAWALRCKTTSGIWEDASDDGEVSGCASKPIMIVLQQLHLINVMIIVTRYYGGVNLGPAGLIKAYSSTTRQIIENIGFE
jgi:putative IMPACT (imprinted ancient) family translation regulator